MKVIHVVTVFQKISHEPLLNDSSRYMPDFGNRRCVGWYEDIHEAKCAVENNFSNIHEDDFNYAIIETYEPGILCNEIARELYKWNSTTNSYELIDIPVELSKVSNFGIG